MVDGLKEKMQGFFLVFVSLLLFFGSVSTSPYSQIGEFKTQYELPGLDYSYFALEPYIDNATLQAHHSGHHATYTNNMNKVLHKWREMLPSDDLAKKSILEILQDIDKVPEDYKKAVRNQGGGFLNHCIYWACMSPNPRDIQREPIGSLADEITKTFGSFGQLYDTFTSQAQSLFGSGYVWLSRDPSQDDTLVITTTANQDSPVSEGLKPILVLDVWEHSYYLKHQYRRAVYIETWWQVVDWDNVVALDKWWTDWDHRKMHQEL